MLIFFATGISCATYADAWSQPPQGCEQALDVGIDLCGDTANELTITNSLETVSTTE